MNQLHLFEIQSLIELLRITQESGKNSALLIGNHSFGNIIQEFRKIGINLILTTQKLPSSSILPKDLIANRIVFMSSCTQLWNLTINWHRNKGRKICRRHKVQGFLVTKADKDK